MRGQPVQTTIRDKAAARPDERVNRHVQAERPNARWVSDVTDVSTWQGIVDVAVVIDVVARCIVGWKVSRSMRTDVVLHALEHALAASRPARQGELQRSGVVGRLDPFYRALGRSGHGAIRGQRWRLLGQCVGGNHQRRVHH